MGVKMFEHIIESRRAKEILARYMLSFIKSDYTPWNQEFNCRNLPWCFFKVNIKTLDIDDIGKINIPFNDVVYCHDERQKVLYQTTFKRIYEFVLSLEPWEEVDLEIFNNSMQWTLAITHEGELITYGVEFLS